MLLRHIVEQLDAELDRLKALRRIVAGLQSAPFLPETPDARAREQRTVEGPQKIHDGGEPAALVAASAATYRTVSSVRRRISRPGGSQTSATPPLSVPAEQRALTSAIPAGPVVVSAKALAQERAVRQSLHAERESTGDTGMQTPEDPESVARNLALRWLRTPVINVV